jgi:CheY-like chemotaxis protein
MALVSDGAASRAASDTSQGTDGPGPGPPQAPEELIEIQLRAILESTQTSAGAVCLFDQHQELLRLAVEIGLSDEGCRRLRSVRRGAATTWDMPLHSLLNRRVYLIESAAKNRYVPPLVDDVSLVRAVACVPLYDGSTPVGSLILVALAPRTFGERQIRLLEQPVRDLVGHIGAMRKRVSVAMPARTGRPSLSATAVPPPMPGGVTGAGPTAPGVKTAPVAPGAPGAPAGASSIQAAVDRARAELERLHARLAEAEEAVAAERRRAESIEPELAAARAERDRAVEALEARTRDGEPLAERVASLEAALDEARRTEAGLRDDVARAGATAASETTKATETFSARVAELETTNESLRRQVNDLEARDAATRSEAETRIATAVAEAQRLAATTADVETRTSTLASECDALRARLAEAVANHEREKENAENHHAAALAESDTRTVAARDAAAEWQRRCEAAEAELAASRAAASSQSEQADVLAHERAQHETELAAARERERTFEARIAELEAEVDRARSEDLQLRDGFAHLESLIQTGVGSDPEPAPALTLAPALADDSGDGETSSFEVVELDAADGALDDAGGSSLEVESLVIEELEAPEPPASVAPDAPAAAGPAEGVLVLDTDATWTGVAPKDATITVQTPDTALADGCNPERILVNLAAPGAIGAFASLRQAGLTTPAFACVAIPGQGRGLLLGRFDVAERPIDPDALLTSLQGVFARGIRVVTAGADVDGLISLRQALARLGVSVSMAWDAKQAGDLLAMVHPEVAIIDLELPPKDGCALVARMGLVQPAPLTVVVPKPSDTAATFAAALAHPELGRATVPTKELLARVLSQSLKAAAPVRR